MGEQLLIQNYVAGGTLSAQRFVKAHTVDGEVVVAGAAAVPFGITDRIGSPPTIPPLFTAVEGDRVDVVHLGITDLELGGAVSFGDSLAPDAEGKGVAAASNPVGAIALSDGAAGEIIRVLIVAGKGA